MVVVAGDLWVGALVDPLRTDATESVPDRGASPVTRGRALDLQRRRASTYLDKSDLLIRLAQFGILTPAEAEGAALGNIPTSMAAMLAGLPADAQMAARIKWAADIQIGRTHPVIAAAAYALDLSDPLVDQIFGMSA